MAGGFRPGVYPQASGKPKSADHAGTERVGGFVFSIGMGGIYWVVVSEIFPTRVRGAAASLSVVFLWGGNYLVSQFFPAMLASLGGHVFYFYALMCLLCFAFVFACVPETKGKTLEQIEAELFGVHG